MSSFRAVNLDLFVLRRQGVDKAGYGRDCSGPAAHHEITGESEFCDYRFLGGGERVRTLTTPRGT